MNELAGFLKKLNNCDLIVLTPISDERMYCRLFLNGVYSGKLYVSDPVILAELHLLKGEGDKVDAEGVTNLKSKYSYLCRHGASK